MNKNKNRNHAAQNNYNKIVLLSEPGATLRVEKVVISDSTRQNLTTDVKKIDAPNKTDQKTTLIV